MNESSKPTFGFAEARSLGQLPPDEAFLAWGDDLNAALVIPQHAFRHLEAPPAANPADADDNLALFQLGRSLAERWRGTRLGPAPTDDYGKAAFLKLSDFYYGLREHDTGHEAWKRAGEANIRGGVLFHEKKARESVAEYTTALGIYESIGDLRGAGMCHGNIGLVHLHFGDPAETIRECLEAMQAHSAVGYRQGLLMHATHMAVAGMSMGHWERALEFWNFRASLAARVDPTLRALTRANEAQCHFRMGEEERAAASYYEALGALDSIQTPGRLDQTGQELAKAASLLGRPDPGGAVARAHQELLSGIQAVRPDCPPLARRILRMFIEAFPARDAGRLHRSLVQCPRWSIRTWEWLLATAALFELHGQGEEATRRETTAAHMALGICRSLGVRWPLDATRLFECWNIEQKMAATQAFSWTMAAMANVETGNAETAFGALREASRLYASVGHPQAFGTWQEEWASELDFGPERQAQMSQIVIRAKMRSRDGDHHGALHDLEAALELSEVEGSRLNVADKLVRIGIEHHAARHMDEAAVWFNRAVDAFEELETIGPSLAGELGRADNKVKLGIQLGEYLSDAGRYAEAVAVLDRCLLETDWLLECAGPVGNPELLGRAREFKSRGLYSLAQARASLGSFELALGTAREALDWANEVDDEASRAAAYHGIAQAAMELALFPDAVDAASRDVEIQRRRGDGRDIAIALNTLAEVDLRSGDHVGAAEARREALEVLEEAARKGDVRRSMSRANLRLRSMILAGLADAERNAGHLDEALAEYRQSLEIDERTGEVLGAVATRTMMAYVTLRLDRADEALGLARHAWQDSAALQSHPSRVGAGHVLALCLMNARSVEAWTEASNVLLEVCAMIDRMRRGIRDEGLRALQSMSRSDPYDLLITCLSTLAKMTGDAGLRRRTFEAVERAKARSLIEAIAGEAEQKARAAGVELGGITQYIQDERENLPRLRFEDIQAMLAAEAEGQGKW